MDTRIQELIDVSIRNGVLEERARVLGLIIKYQEAGWIDDALVVLLTQDICEGQDNGSL